MSVSTNPSPNSNRNSIRADDERRGPRSTNDGSAGSADDTDVAPRENVLRQRKKLAQQIPNFLQYASIDNPLPENLPITARHASVVRRFATRPPSSIERRYCRQRNPAGQNATQLTVTHGSLTTEAVTALVRRLSLPSIQASCRALRRSDRRSPTGWLNRSSKR